MIKLRKLLSRSTISRRNRRNILNIQITVLSWLVEFSGFVLIFLGSFILGHQNSMATYSIQTLTFFLYFVIVPSIYLINDSEFKSKIIDTNWYISFLNLFDWVFGKRLVEEIQEVLDNSSMCGDEDIIPEVDNHLDVDTFDNTDVGSNELKYDDDIDDIKKESPINSEQFCEKIIQSSSKTSNSNQPKLSDMIEQTVIGLEEYSRKLFAE